MLSGEFFPFVCVSEVESKQCRISTPVLFSALPVLFTKCQRNSSERLWFILSFGSIHVTSATNNACYSKFSVHITRDLWCSYNGKVFSPL